MHFEDQVKIAKLMSHSAYEILQRKQYFDEIKHIFIHLIEIFRPNHSNIKWLINRSCGTELVNT